jgi:HPt (histidine-containing phosphotransfer) domain-containing protein
MAPDIQRPAILAECETSDLWKLPESLLEFVNSGDEEMVAEILSLFQQDSAERLRELNVALSNHDRVSIRKQAHTLKGASLQVGATALSTLCLEIEMYADEAPEAQLVDLVVRTWECYDRTCREMAAGQK